MPSKLEKAYDKAMKDAQAIEADKAEQIVDKTVRRWMVGRVGHGQLLHRVLVEQTDEGPKVVTVGCRHSYYRGPGLRSPVSVAPELQEHAITCQVCNPDAKKCYVASRRIKKEPRKPGRKPKGYKPPTPPTVKEMTPERIRTRASEDARILSHEVVPFRIAHGYLPEKPTSEAIEGEIIRALRANWADLEGEGLSPKLLDQYEKSFLKGAIRRLEKRYPHLVLDI